MQSDLERSPAKEAFEDPVRSSRHGIEILIQDLMIAHAMRSSQTLGENNIYRDISNGHYSQSSLNYIRAIRSLHSPLPPPPGN